MYSSSLTAALTALVLSLALVDAHTWVEQLNVIAVNGTMMGTPGFPRGNVKRSDPGFSDTAMVNLIPPNGGTVNVINPSQLMCKEGQTTQTQSSDSPRLSASPGAFVALRYQENGHVTLPQNQPGKPTNRGTNFVYFTTQSQATDTFLGIHRQWTADGSGGDKRGRLISTQNFDDGQCYQVNGETISTQRQQQFKHVANSLMGADLWCQQDIQIPADAVAGSTVTLYWVWDWPTMPGTAGFPEGKQEIYTTCMDIDIVAGTGLGSKAVAQKFVQQDFGSAAASSQFTDISNPTAVTSPQMIPFSATSGSDVNAPKATDSAANTVSAPLAAGTPNSVPSPVPATSQTRPSGQRSRPTFARSTFTVYETQTVTVTPTTNIISPQITQEVVPTVTKTQTDMVTLTRYNTVDVKRDSKSIATPAISLPSLLVTTSSDLLTMYTVSSDIISTTKSCSKTAAAYRLRARLPFYVVPAEDRLDTGCLV